LLRGQVILLGFLGVIAKEIEGTATPSLLQEIPELSTSHGTLREVLVADGWVLVTEADIGGVHEGSVVGGDGISVPFEHVHQHVFLGGKVDLLLEL